MANASDKARMNMVFNQISTTMQQDEDLFNAMLQTPREIFIPEALQNIAYIDEHIPLGGGRYLMSPMLFARLLHLTEVCASDTVLDVACGTGYSTAVFSYLADKVIAVESDSELASQANYAINRLHQPNSIIINGRLAKGHPEGGPYNVIFINGAVSHVPDSLTEQLAEGGRLVTVLFKEMLNNPVKKTVLGELAVFQRQENSITKKHFFPVTCFYLDEFDENNN